MRALRFERELVLRLASLLWRMRRAISIETDLLRIQSEIVRERRAVISDPPVEPEGDRDSKMRSPPFGFEPQPEDKSDQAYEPSPSSALPVSVRDLTYCFLRLGNLDSGAFDRLGRYNAALWKQTAQTLFLLHSIRRA
jgi:hypothetical protein